MKPKTLIPFALLALAILFTACQQMQSPMAADNNSEISMAKKGKAEDVPVVPICGGCTPGYWKNHLDSWPEGYDPFGTEVGEIFTIPASNTDCQELKDDLLLEALSYKGGKGELGAARIMLRHSVAALLNIEHPVIDWRTYTKSQLIYRADFRLAYNDRDAYFWLANRLDDRNNEYPCPLN